MEKFMGREEKEKKEKGGYGERLREITAVLKKHAITRGVSPEKLRLILEDLGPTYIKLGQIMSLRSDILPKRYCDELMKLCSEVPPRYWKSPWDVRGRRNFSILSRNLWERHRLPRYIVPR